jgi:hypothetical protein
MMRVCWQKLYHQTLAIRPKLIKLIEKYSQKKGKQEGIFNHSLETSG